MSTEGKYIDGELSVGRSATIGRNVKIRGNGEVGHNLRVKGWLEAPNLKVCNKGYFRTTTELEAAYPSPEAGWWAVASDSNTIYIAINGKWVDSGRTAPDVKIDCTQYEADINEINLRIDNTETDIEAHVATLSEHGERLDALEGRYDSQEHRLDGFDNSLTELKAKDTVLEAKDAQLQDQLDRHDDMIVDNSEEIGLAKGRISDLESGQSNLQAQINSQSETIVDIQRDVETAQNDIATIEKRQQNLQTAISSQSETIVGIQRDVETAQNDILDLKSRATTNEASIAEVGARGDDTLLIAQANEQKITELEQGLTGATTDIASLKIQSDALDDKLSGEITDTLGDLALADSDASARMDGIDDRLDEIAERARVATIAPGWVNLNSLLGTMEPVANLTEALAAVPVNMRLPGMRLTFLRQTGEDAPKEWVTYQYKDTEERNSGQWTDESKWELENIEILEALPKRYKGSVDSICVKDSFSLPGVEELRVGDTIEIACDRLTEILILQVVSNVDGYYLCMGFFGNPFLAVIYNNDLNSWTWLPFMPICKNGDDPDGFFEPEIEEGTHYQAATAAEIEAVAQRVFNETTTQN